MGEKREVDERHKERKNQRNGVDVLLNMFVTAAVFHLERSELSSKGQLICKADWCAIDSPKKRTNEFVLFAFLLLTANKSHSSVRSFFVRIYGAPIWFSILSNL